jgi:hypothetical protein
MRYAHLLVWSLALSFCSSLNLVDDDSNYESNAAELEKIKNDNKTSFNHMPADIITHINGFIGNADFFRLRSVNKTAWNALTLKRRVQQTFKIAGLDNVTDNEPDFSWVLKLPSDSFNFALGLIRHFTGTKKSYQALSRPLIVHLFRIINAFSIKEKNEFLSCITWKLNITAISIERVLARICVECGHFDLLFDFLKEYPREIVYPFYFYENRLKYFKLFRENPLYLNQFLDALIITHETIETTGVSPLGPWISECITNDLPEQYYSRLFEDDPQLMKFVAAYLFSPLHVPESEYSRIHSKISRIFDNYSGFWADSSKHAIFRMINDIRLGSFDINDLDLTDFGFISNRFDCYLIAKAAYLAKKRHLFRGICSKFNLKQNEIKDLIKYDPFTLE